MKKSKIEKFIFENKEELNHLRAPSGLWDKIEEKLPPSPTEKKGGRLLMISTMKVAAISIGLLVSGILIGKMYFSKNNLNFDQQLSQKIEKTEDYYGSLIHFKLDEAKSQDLLDDKLISHLEVLDQEYNELKSRLSEVENFDNEQMMNQLIKNYKLRLSLIELLLDRGKVKNIKSINFNKKDTI